MRARRRDVLYKGVGGCACVSVVSNEIRMLECEGERRWRGIGDGDGNTGMMRI